MKVDLINVQKLKLKCEECNKKDATGVINLMPVCTDCFKFLKQTPRQREKRINNIAKRGLNMRNILVG